MSAGRQTVVDTLIKGLKTNGIWAKLDSMWVFAAENSQSALIDLKALVTGTATTSPTFTADYGYTGDGVKVVVLNYTHTNLTQNSSFISGFGIWSTFQLANCC